MIKTVFLSSLLQSSVSHDSSEIILIYYLLIKRHFWLLSVLKTVFPLLEYEVQNNSILFKYKSFLNNDDN